MLYKKNIQIVLCVFIFLLTGGFAGNEMANIPSHESAISQNLTSLYPETDNEINGICPSIELAESNSNNGFQNFKNGKNGFLLLFSFGYSSPSLFFYYPYCIRRINSFNHTPFYIAFRGLII